MRAQQSQAGKTSQTETATLGGGCFWCLEAAYEQLVGVIEVVSGYAGGQTADPTYKEVCSGMTGHAEVVQIHFDPQKLSFNEILQIFFLIHDPTTLNRQGGDVGTQYRSVIFYHSPEQKASAEKMIARLGAADIWSSPIVTQLVPFRRFYPAEEYHQGYYQNNPNQAYCQVVISPKLTKLRQAYANKLKKERRRDG